MKRDKESGVISLEACILVPMFIMMLMFIYGFFVYFMGHNMMSHALIQSAKSLSLDQYGTEAMAQYEEEGGLARAVVDLFQLTTVELDDTGFVTSEFASTEKWYEDESKVEAEVEKRFMAFLAGNASTTDIRDYLDLIGVSGMDFSESKVEGGELIIVLSYEQEFIYDFQGLGVFDCQLEYKIKMWDNKEIG